MTNRSELVELVAEIGATRWPDLTRDRAGEFVGHYVKYVDDEDLADRDPHHFADLLVAHARLGETRIPGETKLEICQPTTPGGPTALLAVCDDRAFVVDSISIAFAEQGWAILQIFHPQYQVVRDEQGHLIDMVHRAAHNPRARAESWVCCELFPPLGESSADLSEALISRVRMALDHGARAVSDYGEMLVRVSDAQRVLRADGIDGSPGGPVSLLNWLTEDHFTFLGFAEYTKEGEEFVPVPGSGLGLYANERSLEAESIPPAVPFSLAKDAQRSTVHRPSYLDRISIRRIRSDGVSHELRFVGLFASSTYQGNIKDIPYLEAKAQAIIARTGYDHEAHGAKAIAATLASYPRDEMLQATVDELYRVVVPVSRLNERRTVRLFVRFSPDGRFVSALVFFPRDRYNTRVREEMQDILMSAFHASSVEHQAQISESSLARLYFVLLLPTGGVPKVDPVALEKELAQATRTWDDGFIELARGLASEERGIEFSEGYREAFSPEQAIADLRLLNSLGEGEPGFTITETGGELRLKVYLREQQLTLSAVLPQLVALGVEVLDEWPYEIELRGEKAWLYEFSLKPVGFAASPEGMDRLVKAFAASLRGQVEADSFTALVTKASLSWEEASVMRTIARYLRQTGAPYSQTYIARSLASNPEVAKDLSCLFHAKFDPATRNGSDSIESIRQRLATALESISSLDVDRIIRRCLAVIEATSRTNAFAVDGPFAPGSTSALALKLRTRELAFAPEPRPKHEVYVYSPMVEGVHLRFADVARGGLRWSDRAEDYRTEILGLVKAQMVKNTVIVPSGAKGGFFPRQLPDQVSNPKGWREAGVQAYRAFVTALLSVTDNIVAGEVVTPAGVVALDGPDPYLVVAADKGTATLSDVANGIAVERGFWLGDAFASGGSNGYDHKKMGITARGAWESVRRHFHEMGVDAQHDDFTCVGIGDMAGDVFGNGMLLSKHIRLIAAFNHRHIFIDPNPDTSGSFVERQRLFNLPGSNWSDYSPELISEGGGVFDRSAKEIQLLEQAAEALGTSAGNYTPDQVIRAILRAPVDLLWNGGIGTYVKARSESNAEVGDKANDGVRVDGCQIRAKVAGEGGNLGWTQAGRIEFARLGGRVNTDFIDNSAGVDTSDHEVNIKILLAGPVASGALSEQERNQILESMTDDIASHVLAHNIDQNLALANARASAKGYVGLHESWMQQMSEDGYLDRELEGLPGSDEMARRIDRGEGLSGPELSTLLAWTKIWLSDAVLASDLPDDSYVAHRLREYFPSAVRERFSAEIESHQLRREIITTVAVNRFVNSQGISSYFQLAEATGGSPADIIRAQLASRAVFSAARFEAVARSTGLPVNAETDLRLELRSLVDRGTRWLLQNRPRPLSIEAAVDELREPVQQVLARMRGSLTSTGRHQYDEKVRQLGLENLDEDLIAVIAGARIADRALSFVDIAARYDLDPADVAQQSFALDEATGLDRLGVLIDRLPQFVRWDALARNALQAELGSLRDALLCAKLSSGPKLSPHAWLESRSRSNEVIKLMEKICTGDPQLSKASVALRAIRGLLD